MIEAFSMVGIEKNQLIDARRVQQAIEKLPQEHWEFIELQTLEFMQSYGKRRTMPPGLERTRFVLSKLTDRPVYYLWLNPEMRSEKCER